MKCLFAKQETQMTLDITFVVPMHMRAVRSMEGP